MRVALDATPLSVETGGVNRYTAELSRALARGFPEDEFVLVSDQSFELPAAAPPNLTRGGGPRTMAERRWWLWGLERELTRQRAGVFHGVDFSVPYLGRRPSVMTLHDLSPWRDPAWQPDAGRVRLRTPILLRLGLATMVITPSEAVRREAIERFRLEPERVVAVPLAAPSWLQPAVPPSREQNRRAYFLFVGTLEPRKNVDRLIEAWRAVRSRFEVDLILAGRLRPDGPGIAEEPGLIVTGSVADKELASLYAGALAFVYPSLYEGFGLPVLEAMQCGALVITSRDPAIQETGGDAAIYVDAGDTRALAAALEAVAASPGGFEHYRRRAIERAAEFTWTRTAARTREIYDEARKRFGR